MLPPKLLPSLKYTDASNDIKNDFLLFGGAVI